MKINVPFRRKDVGIETNPCVVEKTVEMPADLFAYFSHNLLDDYDFILENIDLMYQDKDGVKHCLLVLGEGQDDGILVESEGSAYARYSAFVPNARQLWQQTQRYEPALQSFCDRMQTAIEEILCTAPQLCQDGMLRVPLLGFAASPGEYPLDTALLSEMLSGQPEFDSVELFGDEIVAQMNPAYLPAEKEQYEANKQDWSEPSDPVLSM